MDPIGRQHQCCSELPACSGTTLHDSACQDPSYQQTSQQGYLYMLNTKSKTKKTLNIFSSSSTNTHTPYQMVPTVIWSSCAPQGSVDSTSANGQGQRSHCCSIMLPVSQTAAHTTPAAAPPQAGEGIKTRMKNKMN